MGRSGLDLVTVVGGWYIKFDLILPDLSFSTGISSVVVTHIHYPPFKLELQIYCVSDLFDPLLSHHAF